MASTWLSSSFHDPISKILFVSLRCFRCGLRTYFHSLSYDSLPCVSSLGDLRTSAVPSVTIISVVTVITSSVTAFPVAVLLELAFVSTFLFADRALQSLVEDLAVVDPDFDADLAVCGVRLSETIIDVGS